MTKNGRPQLRAAVLHAVNAWLVASTYFLLAGKTNILSSSTLDW